MVAAHLVKDPELELVEVINMLNIEVQVLGRDTEYIGGPGNIVFGWTHYIFNIY